MITPKVSFAAVLLALTLLFAAGAQAGPADQIKFPPKGQISPEGWAVITVSYSCAPRAGDTYIDTAVIQDGTSSFEDQTGPLTCNGKPQQVVTVSGGDLEPYRFVPGPARVEASFYNAASGYGPRVTDTVTLR